jgi:hypothetical protein
MPNSKAINASKFFGKDRYEHYLNELLTENTIGGQKLSKQKLKEGFSKRKNKISFEKFIDKIVSTKTAKTSVAFSGKGPPSSPAASGGNGNRKGSLVRSSSNQIQKYIGISQKTGEGVEENISAIVKSVISIADIVAKQKKISDDASAYEKRKSEQEKRGLAESKLEKRFEGLRKAAEKIIAPVKSLLDKILQFFTTVILGRIVYKLVEWLGDPNNANKVKSIIRFLGDWGPAILGGFILFGTKFGKSIRVLTNIALSGIAKLAKSIPALLRFAKSNPKTALAVAAGGYAATQLAQRAFSGEDQKVEGRAGGGVISAPKFFGGGFNFSGLLGGARNFFNGMVSGEKGVDKIPAWLSDGEFVMSRGAVQKYGVDTLEAMNAAGGGTNKPTFKTEGVYAAGGGLVGDIPLYSSYGVNPSDDTLRLAARTFKQYGTEEELFKAFKKLNGVPDFLKMVGGENNFSRIFQGHHAADDALDAIRQSVADKIKAVNNPQPGSVTKSISALQNAENILSEQIKSNRSSLRETGYRMGTGPTPQSRFRPGDFRRFSSLQNRFNYNPFRGQSSPLIRQPIPASRAIVPYTGGGLARTGVTGGLSVPQIKTNMRVPGGFGNLKSLGVELLLSYLVQSGLDYVEAKRLASSIEKARKESPEKLTNRIEKLRELVDKEERYQKSFGGILDKIIKMGGETGSERLSRQARTMLGGLGANAYQGGAIKGGYGLKQQSFKDMPKTQIMTDDKGRPFVGYKAMRGGKVVYVRGPQSGQGTSNPLETLGRMINPGAYKNIDAINARKKYEEASKGNISSLKARGATQANIAKKQAELNKRKPVSPPIKQKPKVVVAGGGMGGRRGSGSNPSTSKVPNFNASTKGMRSKQETLGLMR